LSAQIATTHRPRVLLVEDEPATRLAMREFLSAREFEVFDAVSCRTAFEAARTNLPDAILLDFALPDGDALQLLPRLREIAPDAGIVLLTGHATVELAVRAIKSGADHFLCKPVQLAEIESALTSVCKQRRLERARRAERLRTSHRPLDPFIGDSPAIRALADEARQVADSHAPVLILGPTGSGKGVLASWLHSHSPRTDDPFVDINCASLSREFLESELFGHRRGAFTGAVADKPGLLEVAHHGTLFLDEVGDMATDIQPRLLKVLEEGRYRRMGDVTDREADVRLIAATHQDLGSLVRQGRFREDLYFRIHTLPLRVPGLRERQEDIPALAERILDSLARESGRPDVRLAHEAIAPLQRYEWPGNVRELRNVLERSLLLCRGNVVTPSDLHFQSGHVADDSPSAPKPSPATWRLDDVERSHILAALEACQGRVREAAIMLGVPRSTLYQKLRQFGVRLRA
jgi:DNA-binding NtrC family response regulator